MDQPIAQRRRNVASHKAVALDQALTRMFRAMEQRSVPDRITSVVEQLDEGEPRLRRLG
jgi:hypothetical protein